MIEEKVLDLDLRKQLVLDLKKQSGMEGVVSRVMAAIDYSGSMEPLYKNNTVQDTVERILPIALGFDDDGEADMFKFDSVCVSLKETLNRNNYQGYVKRNFTGSMGGTNYSPIILEIMRKVGVTLSAAKQEKKGFLSKLFGGKEESKARVKLTTPVYALIITDGDCFDRDETEALITEASNYGVFFQFVGIGNARFAFLDKLDNLSGRTIDNAGFFKITDLSKISDQELYSLLLKEYPSWYKEAKNKGII